MQVPGVTLRRLFSPTDVKQFLATFGALLMGQAAAVFDAEGKQVVPFDSAMRMNGWASQVGALLQTRPPVDMEGQPLCVEGAVCYPLLLDQRCLGWLVIETAAPVGPAMQAVLENLLAERVEKRRLARETLDRYREVNMLYHLTDRFGASLDVGEILQIVLAEAGRVIQATCGIVWLAGTGTAIGSQAAVFGAMEETEALDGFARAFLHENPGMAAADIVTDFDVSLGVDERVLSSVLYAPLRVSGSLLGLLALGKRRIQAEFTAGDQKLLQALAGQAAGAVEKAILHQQDLQHQKIAQELAIGQRIQRSLLPKKMPVVPGWEFAASYRAANQVGGDFYAIFPLPAEPGCGATPHYGLTIADVTGEGIPAALMMAFSQGILHTAAIASPLPGEVLYQTNQSILQSSHSDLLLTAFYAVLDPSTGILKYANGGHEPPLLYRAATGQSQELNCGHSLLLGMRQGQPYQAFETRLDPGDMMLLYTDGVTEARNITGDFFAEDRLYEVLMQNAPYGCGGLIDALNQSLQEFSAGAAQSDDITLFALRRLP